MNMMMKGGTRTVITFVSIAGLALLSSLTEGTLFRDCGDAASVIHFSSIASLPDPVIVGGNQTVVKKGWADVDVPKSNFTATFSQYWCPASKEKCTSSWNTAGWPWIRFLKININVCDDHPDMCPLARGKNFTTSAKHPPLSKLTPQGWYRSRQEYHGANGAIIGCADMIIQYTKA